MQLEFPLKFPVEALNGGVFISRGVGSHPVRVIDSHELIVVRSGVLEMFEDEEQFRAGPGTTLMLQPGHRHGGAAPYPPDLSFYWFHFLLKGQRRLTDRIGQDRVFIPRLTIVPDAERLSELCTRFLDEQETRGAGPGNLHLNLWLLMILADLFRGRPSGEAPLPHPLAAKARQRIEVEAFSPQCTSWRLAEELRCNPDYLGRVFKASYGRSMTEMIQAIRMRRARHLLIATRLGMKEIAQDCGMGDPAFFRKLFKIHTGTTPGTFRRLHGLVHVNTE